MFRVICKVWVQFHGLWYNYPSIEKNRQVYPVWCNRLHNHTLFIKKLCKKTGGRSKFWGGPDPPTPSGCAHDINKAILTWLGPGGRRNAGLIGPYGEGSQPFMGERMGWLWAPWDLVALCPFHNTALYIQAYTAVYCLNVVSLSKREIYSFVLFRYRFSLWCV